MAKPRRAKKKYDYTRPGMRRLVREVVDVLTTGEPTVFRYEAVCRHALRSAFCLVGWSWPSADALAADLVRIALELIGAQRPPWAWGQPEYTSDSTATRIGFTHCLNCGTRLDEDRFKFCGKRCGNLYRNEFEKSLEAIAADRVRISAAREAYRRAARWLRCETCNHAFKPSRPQQRFCSVACAGRRAVHVKMNGHKHPWMNGKSATGGNGANGAGHPSPTMPTSANGSAIADASVTITMPSSDASVARRATG